jgi:hypothetical protein
LLDFQKVQTLVSALENLSGDKTAAHIEIAARENVLIAK